MRQVPEHFGVVRARWRLADLRRAVDWLGAYSLAGVSRALRRLGVRRRWGRLALHSPDPAYAVKLRWVARALTLAQRPGGEVVVLYGDEFSVHRHPTLALAYAPRKAPPVARLAASANTRYRIAGALNVVTGQLTWLGQSKVGVLVLKRFLRKLRRTYPTGTLLLIWDNWPIHLHEAVLAEAAALDIELLWLPTYAPWTNPIEKVWRACKQDLLHHHRLAERWPELRRRVRDWLDQFTHPSPALLHAVGLLPE